MDTIPKIEQYINSEKHGRFAHYQISSAELYDLVNLSMANPDVDAAIHSLCLAFDYGRAKGYRAAKAEMRAKA